MFWSNKSSKSVSFSDDAADQDLLTAIEIELTRQPYKSFSDLCKDALRQSLLSSGTRSDSSRVAVVDPKANPRTSELEQQIAELRDRVTAIEGLVTKSRESRATEGLEYQLSQLTSYVAQLLSVTGNQPTNQQAAGGYIPIHETPAHETPAHETPARETEVQNSVPATDTDAMLQHISPLLDNF